MIIETCLKFNFLTIWPPFLIYTPLQIYFVDLGVFRCFLLVTYGKFRECGKVLPNKC